MSCSCNGTDCANTPVKPLSTPLVNEMFSEAWDDSDRADSLCGQKKNPGYSLWPLSAACCSPNLPGKHNPPQKLFLSSRALGRNLRIPSTGALLKKPLSHPTAIFSAVLISQWPAQFQLSEIQAAGLNSSVRLQKCNQMLESYRAVLSPESEQRLLVSGSEKEEINAGTWKDLTNRGIILQGIAGTSRLSWG